MSLIKLDIDQLKNEQRELSEFLSRPDAFSDPDYAKKNRRLLELDELIATGERQAALKQHLQEAKELAGGNDELAELAKDEIPTIEQELAEIDEKLFIMLTPKDPNDEKNIIVEIRAGAGGDEAAIFAGDLLRMYLRFCETHSFKTEMISESQSDSGGYKEVIFGIKGDSH